MSQKKQGSAKSQKKKGVSALESLDKEELEELKSCFDLFDEDQSGVIDPPEIKKALESLGLDKRNAIVQQMLEDLQEPGGPIDFETFVEIVTQRLGDNKSKDGVFKLFNLYDIDQSGTIDFDKIKRIAKELGETMNDQELQDMMHHIHVLNRTEKKEEIQFEEFYEIVTKKNY